MTFYECLRYGANYNNLPAENKRNYIIHLRIIMRLFFIRIFFVENLKYAFVLLHYLSLFKNQHNVRKLF